MGNQAELLTRDAEPSNRTPMMPETPDSAALMAAISRAASDPSVDVAKMERLMTLYERVQTKRAEQAFNEAMTAAQNGMKPIAADASNPQTRSKYASYPALDRAVRPIYTKHGFALSFDTGDAPENMVKVLCHVSHCDGHSRTYHVDMPADGKGAKGGDVMTRTHATGSALSYGQRYLVKLIFNIAVGDDDGVAASNMEGPISADQVQHIRDLIERTKSDVEAFCIYMNAESIPMILAKDYDKAIMALNLKERKAAK